MKAEKITGVILAGGKNSRMGTDKGLLMVDGKKIIERIIAALKPVVDEIIIVSNGNNYNNTGYKVYRDIIKECGPMGGIHTALSFSNTEKNLVVSCDMPFLNTETLKFIAENSNICEIAIPEHNKITEPLCAVYSSVCRNKFSQLIARGEWKLRDSLKYFNVKTILFENKSGIEKIFSNINTKEEYKNLTENEYEYTS